MIKIKEYLKNRFNKPITKKERWIKCLELVRRNIVIASETRDRTQSQKDKSDITECINIMKQEKKRIKKLIKREDK